MKRLFPLFLVFFGVILFFQPVFVKQFLPIPADTIIGLYHPFRDLYAKDYPRGIPYKNFLTTDPVLQQYPWKNLAVSLEKQLTVPLWNPYSFSGMPLLANLQSSALYPFNIVFLLFSFPVAWTILIILQPILATLFMYLYLKNLKLHTAGALLGSFVFAFSGFSLMWLEWGTVVQTGLWLPLLLLTIDKILQTSHRKNITLWSLCFVFALTASFFAGHLQTFFYLSVTAFLYLYARLLQNKESLRRVIIFTALFVAFVAIASVQWIPLLQLINLSARAVDHESFQMAGWFLPWQNTAQFIAPDFFGNPATLNYWGVWNYMEFAGYVGLFPLLLAAYSLLFVRMKKVYFFGLLLLGGLVFILPTPIAKLPFLLRVPFIETSQPTRLLYIIDFSLSVLAGIGFSSLRSVTKKTWISFSFLLIGLASLWIAVLQHKTFGITFEQSLVVKQNLIFPSLILAGIFVSLLVFQVSKNTKRSFAIFSGVVILITCIDLFRFGYKFTPFTPAQYLYPTTKALNFLTHNSGEYRIMETSREVMSPNISVMYHLQSVDGYDPLYLKEYGEYIAASERGKPDINPPFGFNRIITPQRYDSRLINLLGVKYVLSLEELSNKNLKKVFEEGETKIYENQSVLPRVFFVNKVISSQSKQDTMNKLFDKNIDLKNTAILENNKGQDIQYAVGRATIQLYSPNKIIVKTENELKGFLVLTDVYYPTWHASVDGEKVNIFLINYLFRGIEVPAGNHTVLFTDSLF